MNQPSPAAFANSQADSDDPFASIRQRRSDFPILQQHVRDQPLVYLDNAATSQKPQVVIDALTEYYQQTNANVHRGIHFLSEKATREYEQARGKIQRLLNAQSSNEIVFVRGATEGINLVAQTYGRSILEPGDEILISEMEHHSNIVPWQMVAEQTGAKLVVTPITDAGELCLDSYHQRLSNKTKMVALTAVSNVLGTVTPVAELTRSAHQVGAKILIDACQAVPRVPVDVQAWDCDFLVFSGHKFYAPTGIGVLYGKYDLLENMPPYQGGGEMIQSVSFEKTTYHDPPHRFEAGTPNIGGAIALGAAADYATQIGLDAISAFEEHLWQLAFEKMSDFPGLSILGSAAHRVGVLSFVMEQVHPHDLAMVLDQQGVAIRTGHHCAEPLMHRLGVTSTARASLSFYNNEYDIEALISGLHKAISFLT